MYTDKSFVRAVSYLRDIIVMQLRDVPRSNISMLFEFEGKRKDTSLVIMRSFQYFCEYRKYANLSRVFTESFWYYSSITIHSGIITLHSLPSQKYAISE